jgi:hypothetical protein
MGHIEKTGSAYGIAVRKCILKEPLGSWEGNGELMLHNFFGKVVVRLGHKFNRLRTFSSGIFYVNNVESFIFTTSAW